MEDFSEQFISVSPTDGSDKENYTGDDVEHKEVDPFKPVAVQIMSIDETSYDEAKITAPTKVIDHSEEAGKLETGKKTKVRKTRKVEEIGAAIGTRAFKAPVATKKAKPLVQVSFEGSFGNIKAGYLDVYHQGVYLILVEDINSEFSYAPPESEESFFLVIGDDEFEVISPGIRFDMKGQKVKITVLLKIGVTA